MQKILFIGCSNLVTLHECFRKVFNDDDPVEESTFNYSKNNKVEWINLSANGAGNAFIRWRLFDYIKNESPDYVYLQFSGLVRRDYHFDSSNKENFPLENNAFNLTEKKLYMCGGNYNFQPSSKKDVVDSKWNFPNNLNSLSYSFMDDNSNNFHSLQEIYCALSILEKLEIKHKWSIYYDPLDPPTDATKLEGVISQWPNFINQEKMLPSPLNYAIKKGAIVNDGVHFGFDSFIQFIKDHKGEIDLKIDAK